MVNLPRVSPIELNGVNWVSIIPFKTLSKGTDTECVVHVGLYYGENGEKKTTYLTFPDNWSKEIHYRKEP